MAAFRPDGALGSRQAPAGLDRRLRALDPRISVRAVAALLLLALALAACGKRRASSRTRRCRRPGSAASTAHGEGGVTPMAQRVAVLGILNKRNGIVQDVALHPGQSARWKDVIVRLRACETTAPWEEEKLTGAFVQVDVQRPRQALGPGLLGLALQGIAVAQRRRAPGLRRLAQELRDDISGGPAGAGRAGQLEQPVERDEIGRRVGAPAPSPTRRRRRPPRRRRRAPPTTTRHRSRAAR